MTQAIFKTSNDYAPLLLRLFLAIVIFPHGAQKLLGWFGGYGFEGTMGYFTETAKLPWILGFQIIFIEFFAPIALLFGFATRIWAAATGVVILGIIITAHHDYFFMNWFGSQPAEGMEYFLLALAICTALVISGGGRLSADYKLQSKIN